MKIQSIATTPFAGQTPGTSGLRKKVREFQQPRYLENFIQSIFNAVEVPNGATLVVGGDGRYFNREALRTIIRLSAGNRVGRLIVGRDGILSTPAASNLIRIRGAFGGIILSASHNPAGPNGDFGIKFNGSNGGPASEAVTDRISHCSRTIKEFWIGEVAEIDLELLGEQQVGQTVVEVVDPVSDYADCMERLFDFAAIRQLFKSGFRMRFDAMHAVTGPYATEILENRLSTGAGTVMNGIPLPDFGGGHPDPNLLHAQELVQEMFGANPADFAAASDGDGDRNMVLGRHTYVGPGDSLAILAANAHLVPGYADGLKGVARSMVTSAAVDRVAGNLGIKHYATPTGWKFFGTLLDAGLISLCGEESFGTGSDHLREKDGLWAVLFWLNIIAATGKTVAEIQRKHWQQYGRNYFTRHDFEGLPEHIANRVIESLRESIRESASRAPTTKFFEYSYKDPVDGSESHNQGFCFHLDERDRIVYRLSGTGTEGATLRVYLEHYEHFEGNLGMDPQEALSKLIAISRILSGMGGFGIVTPSAVT